MILSNLNDVTVVIDIQRPTPKIGLGKPLIIGSADKGADYKVYYELSAVLEDHPNTTEVYKAAYALFNQGDNSPESIAVMMREKETALTDWLPSIFTKDWYYLVSTDRTAADITTIGDAVEQDDSRLFFAASSSKTDMATFLAKKWERTIVFYHKDIANYPEAAWIGDAGSAEAGATTWKFHMLNGITPLELSRTELEEIHALGANTYVVKAGDAITSEGKTVSGEYIDIVQSKDWLIMNIETAVQKLFNRASAAGSKIPYDNRGISQIEGEVLVILKRADLAGMIAHDDNDLPIYSTSFKPRSQVDPADREQRVYNGGSFEFELAGAIHKTKITGLIKL
ncbi:DUF3383 family protein [Paenibacillus macerans]|uniref:DUF3383 family protein n=1 Tax=Paenibacillus macerans TaxID=44252 RepID=UPI001E3ED1EC|nr:DUF3383 family protein [Paenibacillus macerans]